MSNSIRKLSLRKMVPFPGHSSSEQLHQRSDMLDCQSNMNLEMVKSFLCCNPTILDSILMEHVTTERLKDILQKKIETENDNNVLSPCKKPSMIDEKYKNENMQLVVERCLNDISKVTCLFSLLRDAINTVANVLNADGFRMYVPTHNETDLETVEADGSKKYYGPIGYRMTVAAHAAIEKKGLLIKNILQDTRFPDGVPHGSDIYSVVCMPLMLPDGDLLAIAEFHRDGFKDPFTEKNFQVANAMFVWNLACLHLNQINKVLQSQQEMNDFLLETTKILFDDVISIDTLVHNIMIHTKDLVSAERCALFLIDHDNHELFADFFDEGIEEDGEPVFIKKKQLRLPFDEGIVTTVAKTGQIINVKDACKDDRFTKNVDKQTGYTTRNVLCMPIIGQDGVIGVVELINSLAYDHFTKADENAFKMFAVYCALALHYSKLYSLLQKQQDQYKVAMEVLQYHILAGEDESGRLLDQSLPALHDVPAVLHTFDFYGGDYIKMLPKFFLHMIDDLFGTSRYEIKKLVNFVLTVRKNYRHVMYHNWKHGFHVAHCLYMMIKTSPGVFSTNEALALVLAGICHDVDHRGFNNAYFQKLNLPLAALYSTSVMEQHHYKQTVMILQSKDNDILSNVSPQEYKMMLEIIREAIIATDLALYFENQKILTGLLSSDTFHIKEQTTRHNVMSLMMTGADLCAVAKPWNTQQETANEIYEEFYYQGDEEKKQGLVPIPMMDRNKKDEIPQQQVGFIRFICSPLYTTLKQILPSTAPLFEGSMSNATNWQVLADTFKEKQAQNSKENN